MFIIITIIIKFYFYLMRGSVYLYVIRSIILILMNMQPAVNED